MYSAFEKETLKKNTYPICIVAISEKKIGIYDAIFLSNM